jgi:TetR/AcrR family transcriptional regulator, cholesterol catabolism regulator
MIAGARRQAAIKERLALGSGIASFKFEIESIAMKFKKKELSDRNLKRVMRIGNVAAKLFNTKGYLQTTMNDITIAARFSKGGIYHYFSSKDEILFFVLDRYLDLVLQDLEYNLAKIATAREKIQYIISHHLKLYTENPAEAKTLLNEKYCLPRKYRQKIDRKERQYFQIVRKVLVFFFAGKQRLPDSQITVITFLLFGMCNWIFSWYDPRGAVNSEALSEIIWKIFLSGVDGF